MTNLNSKFEQFTRCNFGGGTPKAPKPPAPPPIPSKDQAAPVAKKSLGDDYDSRRGRQGTILTDLAAKTQDSLQKKTLLGQ